MNTDRYKTLSQELHHIADQVARIASKEATSKEVAELFRIRHQLLTKQTTDAYLLAQKTSADFREFTQEQVQVLKQTLTPVERLLSAMYDVSPYHDNLILLTEPEVEEGFLTEIKQLLTTRKYTILNKRFGLEGDPPQTLQAVADNLNLSKSRIRQIEMNAIRQLAIGLRSYTNYALSQTGKNGFFTLREFQKESLSQSKPLIQTRQKNKPEDKASDLDTLNLKPRTYWALTRAGITSTTALKQLSDKDVLRIRGIGFKSYAEIKTKLGHRTAILDLTDCPQADATRLEQSNP